jgi:hypothetical protein
MGAETLARSLSLRFSVLPEDTYRSYTYKKTRATRVSQNGSIAGFIVR